MLRKMKDLLIIILFSSTLLLLSCNEETTVYPQYEPYIIDVMTNETSIKPELTIWEDTYFEKEAVTKEKEIVFNDRTYTGKYAKSIIKKWNSYVTDIYTDDEGVKIGFKENTNQLVMLDLMNDEFFKTEPFKDDIDNSKYNAISLAKKIASKYISINQYELITEDSISEEYARDDVKSYITYYTFTFMKKFNVKINSSDYLSIKITSKGNLAALYMGDLNFFDNLENRYYVIEDVNRINNIKVLSTYKSLGYEVLDQKINYQRLVVTPKGVLALYSCIDVKLMLNSEEKNTEICLLTYFVY